MNRLRTLSVVLLFALFAAPSTLDAQRAPSGLGPVAAGLLPSSDLGGGALLGLGGEGWLGISSKVSLGGSALFFGTNNVEEGSAEGRRFNLVSGSLNLRASLVGEDTDLALLLSPGLQSYELEAHGTDPARTETLPVLGVGAGVRFPVVGPLHVSISARDWLTAAQEDALGVNPGSRGLAHSPELRISVSALLGSSEPSLPSSDRTPIHHRTDFQPVEAAGVRFDPYHATQGRDHLHVEEGEALELRPVDPSVVDGDRIPTRQTLVMAGGPLVDWSRTDIGTLTFDAGSAVISDDHKPLVRDAAQFLADNPQAQLELRAFTDEAGGLKDHLSLAEKRGTAIADRLINLFEFQPYRIDVVAFGADEQADTSEMARRVEIVGKTPK